MGNSQFRVCGRRFIGLVCVCASMLGVNAYSTEKSREFLVSDDVVNVDGFLSMVVERADEEFSLTGPDVASGVDIDENAPAVLSGVDEDSVSLICEIDSACSEKEMVKISVDVRSADGESFVSGDPEFVVSVSMELQSQLPARDHEWSAEDVGEYIWAMGELVESIDSMVDSVAQESFTVVGQLRDI